MKKVYNTKVKFLLAIFALCFLAACNQDEPEIPVNDIAHVDADVFERCVAGKTWVPEDQYMFQDSEGNRFSVMEVGLSGFTPGLYAFSINGQQATLAMHYFGGPFYSTDAVWKYNSTNGKLSFGAMEYYVQYVSEDKIEICSHYGALPAGFNEFNKTGDRKYLTGEDDEGSCVVQILVPVDDPDRLASLWNTYPHK